MDICRKHRLKKRLQFLGGPRGLQTRVTIQKIKSLLQFEFYVVKGGATNRDMSLTEAC